MRLFSVLELEIELVIHLSRLGFENVAVFPVLQGLILGTVSVYTVVLYRHMEFIDVKFCEFPATS